MRSTILLTLLTCALSYGAAPTKEWTLFFYLAGDEAGFKSFNDAFLKKIESIPGLTADSGVQLVLQYDDAGEDPNYRYVLQYQENPSQNPGLDTPPIPEADIRAVDPTFQYGEQDSGSAVTLQKFLRWGVQAYPARHYGLIVSGHSYGIYGMLQDFYVPSRVLPRPSIMRNYEVRRALEELYRENSQAFPEGKIDFLLVDSCLSGNLDVLLEFKDLFTYIAASSLELPDSGLPYDKLLGSFIDAVDADGADQKSAHQILEDSLLKPFPRLYTKSHSRGGHLASEAQQIEPVEAFSLRTEGLGAVADAFKDFISSIPSAARDDWHQDKIPSLETATDSNDTVDLIELKNRFDAYFHGKYEESHDNAWLAPVEKLKAFAARLGTDGNDPIFTPSPVSHAGAAGAWAHIQIDELTPNRDLAACWGLSLFALLNDHPENQDFLPIIHDRGTDEVLPPRYFDCNAIARGDMDPEVAGPELGVPARLDTIFHRRIESPTQVPVYMTEVPAQDGTIASRWLSVWIPLSGNERNILLRVPGTTHARLDYLSGSPDAYITRAQGYQALRVASQDLKFPPAASITPSEGLYVSESHSNGAFFRRGLGILLVHDLPDDQIYRGGRRPIEQVEQYPYQMRLEDYFQSLLASQTYDSYAISGADFYRAHRITATGWADFLFAPNP